MTKKVKKKKISAVESLLEMAKKAEEIDKKYGYSGPIDVARNHDKYLYGRRPL